VAMVMENQKESKLLADDNLPQNKAYIKKFFRKSEEEIKKQDEDIKSKTKSH
jgi:hypothetical protein